ncbi:MAG: hypothetical protein MUF18_01150 [Fimbriiglobus sp.]|nr:hypothetical protein [Fimbriiglobus sp.]
MKRAAAAFVLVAGVGGCMTATPGTKQATTTLPAETRGATPERTSSGFRPVGSRGPDMGVIQANALGVDKVSGADSKVRQVNGWGHGHGTPPGGGPPLDPGVYGPTQRGIGTALGHGGIMPAPGMGPWGAVALVPGAATGPGGGAGGMYANGRSEVKFVSTPSTSKMRIAFQTPTGFVDTLSVPQSYNFVQGNIYRLRLTNIPNRPEAKYYPTLEVYPAARETITFLSHGTVPIGFTDEDFEQVKNGNLVVKAIYLPSSAFQDVAATEEIVSTRLEPGADPVAEATRRGTVLAVVRIGNANLENESSPALDAPPGMNGPGGGMMAPPAGMGMGMAPPKGMPAPSAPLSAGPIPPANGAVPKVDAALPSPRSSDASSAKPVRGVPGELPPISLPTATK